MADHHPLRRWKPFLAAFGAIDAAIEAAAGPGASRDEFRRARCGVVERLCDTSDEGERDELCRDLDRAMVQALLTLRAVPVAPATLARTELVPAVRALRRHECGRVRALASDIVCGWRAAAEGDLVKVRAASDKLAAQIIVVPADRKRTPPAATGDAPSEHDAPHSPLAANAKAGSSKEVAALAVGTGRRSERVESIKNTSRAAVTASTGSNVNDPSTRRVPGPAASKKTALASSATTARSVRVESTKVSSTTTSRVTDDSSGSGDRDVSCIDGRIEASKRRLRDGYREEADAKRQRKIQFIKAPETAARQRDERKQHPVTRERSRARYASSVTARRCFGAP